MSIEEEGTPEAGDISVVAEASFDHDDSRPDDYQLLVSSLKDYAIVRLDPQGVVLTWGLGAERLKGYSAEEIVGQHFSLFYTPEDRAAGVPLKLLDRARTNGSVETTGWRLRKDGRRFWGEVSITALQDAAGQLIGFAKVVRDLTDRHEAEETLRRNEERFRLLVNSVVDYAIIGLDPQGLVTTWNPGAQRLKGYSEGEIVGRHFSVFYGPEDRAAGLPLGMLDEARSLGHTEHSGWRVRKDGSRFWGDVVVTAMFTESDELMGFVKITRDLTERHRAEEAVLVAAEREREAATKAKLDRLRADFIESVSHDLRTPIAAIKGFATLLESGAATDDSRRVDFARHIVEGADRLTAMIDDMLEMAKLESGGAQLNFQPLIVSDVVQRVVSQIEPVLDGRPVSVQVPPDLEVQADPSAFERILVNLIANASKFTPMGRSIYVDAEKMSDEAVISVADEGDGVADEEKLLIFERFRQSHQRGDVRTKGSGLGLTIVRDYVNLHGGRVWVEDRPGGGARFVFTLPLPSEGGSEAV